MWLDSLLGLFTPPICKGCGEISSAGLCDACLREMADEPYARCLICDGLTTVDNLCRNCKTGSVFSRAYVIGQSSGVLKTLVYDYKLLPERHIAKTLASLLNETLPILPNGTVITSIPTIPNHIRQRGFGHTELIAKLFARKRRLTYRQLLIRTDNAVQHGLKARERKKAAEKTFAVKNTSDKPSEILLIDDIYTTGSTVNAAAKQLKDSGIKRINLAIIARHSKK